MTYYYDEERPAGYQDADIEMAELEAAAKHEDAVLRSGTCTHSSWTGLAGPTGRYRTPEQEGLSGEQVRCTAGCLEVFESETAILAAREETLL